MGILDKAKTNLKKFVPEALRKRFGMSRRRPHGHTRRGRR